MDWESLYFAALRSRAAYERDPLKSRDAFLSIGDTFIAQTSNMTYQAALSSDKSGNIFLSISGTRLPGIGVKDLWDDIKTSKVSVGGSYVSSGAYEGMKELWDWVNGILGDNYAISVCGHSLGAVRAHLTPLFCEYGKVKAIFSFEAPKMISQEFYDKYLTFLGKMKCVLNGGDIWASYRWWDSSRPNCPHIWLRGNKSYNFIEAKEWPGGHSPSDHSIDLVISRIEEIMNG